METKRCTRCRQHKPVDVFIKNRCKKCVDSYNRYYAKLKDKAHVWEGKDYSQQVALSNKWLTRYY